MCGVCGFVNYKPLPQSSAIIKNMVQCLHHRGPDSNNFVIYADNGTEVALGHTRSAVLDTASAADQPMTYKQFTLVYNGEIYNYKEIRQELSQSGHVFKTNSDTEVLLHAFDKWGVDCVKRFNGMFAFAVYDSITGNLYLVRDRFGVKPLYWYEDENCFLFASELKALYLHPYFVKSSSRIDYSSLSTYMQKGYIPSPQTIFINTHKLKPASFLRIDTAKQQTEEKTYWDLKEFYLKPRLTLSYSQAKEELHSLLLSSFQYRMISDVPVGLFLSSGTDSPLLTAMLQRHSPIKLKTFTIGFSDGTDEAPQAKTISQYIGTEHQEFYFTSEDIKRITHNLPLFYDEPFADSTSVATTFLSGFVRKEITVALSAIGADEMFAGYDRYSRNLNYYSKLNKIPAFLRPLMASGLNAASKLTDEVRSRKLHILSQVLKDKNPLFDSLLKYSSLPFYEKEMFDKDISNPIWQSGYGILETDSLLSKNLYADCREYLPDDLLTELDRAAMSQSLEAREPFLDYRIAEFAAMLPDEYKLSGGVGKRILKDILYTYIPREIMDKPKKGFCVPMASWLQNPLSEYVNYYLSQENVKKAGVFTVKYTEKMKSNFQKNPAYFEFEIWKLLQFYMWYEKWIG